MSTVKKADVRTADQLFAELTTTTGMGKKEWVDFLSCTPEEQELIAKGYRDQSWLKSPEKFGKVLGILAVIGAVAGVVSGVAGAANAVKALKAL